MFKDSSEEENMGNLSPELLNSAQHLEDTHLPLSLLRICLNTGESSLSFPLSMSTLYS